MRRCAGFTTCTSPTSSCLPHCPRPRSACRRGSPSSLRSRGRRTATHTSRVASAATNRNAAQSSIPQLQPVLPGCATLLVPRPRRSRLQQHPPTSDPCIPRTQYSPHLSCPPPPPGPQLPPHSHLHHRSPTPARARPRLLYAPRFLRACSSRSTRPLPAHLMSPPTAAASCTLSTATTSATTALHQPFKRCLATCCVLRRAAAARALRTAPSACKRTCSTRLCKRACAVLVASL